LKIQIKPETFIPLTQIKKLLVDREYYEIISYSFVSEKLQNLLDPLHKPIALANPMSADMDVMRTSLWPGLIQAVLYNQNRQEHRIRFFETGLCFINNGELNQVSKLAGIVCGNLFPEQWGAAKQPVDFFDLKNDLQVLFNLNKMHFTFQFSQHPALHPHQSADIFYQGVQIGCVGALHPDIEKKLEFQSPIYLFEIDLSPIQESVIPSYMPISKFPMIRRDIALLVDQKLPSLELEKKIFNSANELLKNVQIFDIYHGKGIDLGKKSVALGLVFQHPARTLTDNEVNDQVSKILIALEKEFGAKLRE
jgi:phenylalanyl-tRNA synthetase beta chain